MRRVQIALLLLLVAAGLAFWGLRPVRGQTGFIIENADATNTLAVTSSSELGTLINQVAPRFVMEFAKANRYYTLTPVPSALSGLLDTIQPRFVMEFAKANKVYGLTPIPGQLSTLIGQIAPRFVLEYAHANRVFGLGFPIDLIDDTIAPRASKIQVTMVGDTGAKISWTTDEYADSAVACGTESGTYTMTVSDPLFVRVHVLALTALSPDTTYYCRVSSTDQSGNTYRSQEFTFEQAQDSYVYLPLTLRSR